MSYIWAIWTCAQIFYLHHHCHHHHLEDQRHPQIVTIYQFLGPQSSIFFINYWKVKVSSMTIILIKMVSLIIATKWWRSWKWRQDDEMFPKHRKCWQDLAMRGCQDVIRHFCADSLTRFIKQMSHIKAELLPIAPPLLLVKSTRKIIQYFSRGPINCFLR